MFRWLIHFKNEQSPHLAQLKMMGREVVDSPEYYWSGSIRQHKSHIAFQYTISGKGILENTKGRFEVGPNQGFICDPTKPEVCYYYPPKARQKWEFVWFVFIGEVAFSCAEHLISSYGNILTVDSDSPYLNEYLEYGDNHPRSIELPLADNSQMAYELLINLDREQRAKNFSSTSELIVRKTRKLVAQGISRNINATEVAQQLKITREHLSRVFKKSTGINISQYIIQQKISEATSILLTTSSPIHKIAEDLGFSSCSDFIQFFKKHIGKTPTEFRKSPIHGKTNL